MTLALTRLDEIDYQSLIWNASSLLFIFLEPSNRLNPFAG